MTQYQYRIESCPNLGFTKIKVLDFQTKEIVFQWDMPSLIAAQNYCEETHKEQGIKPNWEIKRDSIGVTMTGAPLQSVS